MTMTSEENELVGKLLDQAAKSARAKLLEAWNIQMQYGCCMCFSEWIGEVMAERLDKYIKD